MYMLLSRDKEQLQMLAVPRNGNRFGIVGNDIDKH